MKEDIPVIMAAKRLRRQQKKIWTLPICTLYIHMSLVFLASTLISLSPNDDFLAIVHSVTHSHTLTHKHTHTMAKISITHSYFRIPFSIMLPVCCLLLELSHLSHRGHQNVTCAFAYLHLHTCSVMSLLSLHSYLKPCQSQLSTDNRKRERQPSTIIVMRHRLSTSNTRQLSTPTTKNDHLYSDTRHAVNSRDSRVDSRHPTTNNKQLPPTDTPDNQQEENTRRPGCKQQPLLLSFQPEIHLWPAEVKVDDSFVANMKPVMQNASSLVPDLFTLSCSGHRTPLWVT